MAEQEMYEQFIEQGADERTADLIAREWAHDVGEYDEEN